MSSRRRRGTNHAEETHVDERWLVSYADMITVLMCLFIVLFAMSTVDQKKYEQLSNSLATGFGATDVGAIDTAEGVVVPEEMVNATDVGFSNLELAIQEVNRLTELMEQIDASLQAKGLAHTVEYELDERGLTVRLIGSETFFDNNSINLSGVATSVLDSVAPVLVSSTYQVSVEGHADHRQAAYPFATNWELASGRSTQVLRRLVEWGGMPPAQIASVGYGDARPVAEGSSAAELAKNRRVDIVVLSDQPETVRSLIPMVIERHLNVPEQGVREADRLPPG
ncbi:flagellar motor protein MotB [Homoserinimonas sp. A520]